VADSGALGALLASDQGGNETSLLATVQIVAIVLAYLSVALFVVSDTSKTLPLPVLLVIPAPVLFLQTLQMTLAAAVVGRAASGERIEKTLIESSGTDIARAYRQGLIGSVTSTRITDIRYVGTFTGTFQAVAPYAGFYVLSLFFTIYVLQRAFASSAHFTDRLLCVMTFCFYSAYIIMFAVAAIRSFGLARSAEGMPPSLRLDVRLSRLSSLSVAIASAVGIALQAYQDEDPTPLRLYFTIWSAAACLVGWLTVTFVDLSIARFIAAAGSIGAMVSGVVYWVVLFPANGAGSSVAMIWANIVLHLLLPLAVLLRLIGGFPNWRLCTLLASSTIGLPILFSLSSLINFLITKSPSPYAFLRPIDAPLLFSVFFPVFLAVWLFASRFWRDAL